MRLFNPTWQNLIRFALLLASSVQLVLAVSYPLENPDFANDASVWTLSSDLRPGASTVTVRGQSFESALRLEIDEDPSQAWKYQCRQIIDTRLYPSEDVELVLWMRSETRAEVSFALQSVKAPFGSVLFERVELTPEWRPYRIQQRLNSMVGKGECQISITVGYAAGSVELSGAALNLPGRESVEQPPASYARMIERKAAMMPEVDLAALLPDAKQRFPVARARSIIEGVPGLRIKGKEFGQFETSKGTDGIVSAVLRTEVATRKNFDFQAWEPISGEISKGDTLVAIIKYRLLEPNPETGYGALQLAFEKIGGRYDKLLLWGLSEATVGEWRQCVVPFRADRDLLAGSAQIILRAGYGPQAFELKDMALVNLGSEVKPWDVPQTRMTYIGSDPQAAWRQRAAQRIEQHRKGDFRLRLVDAQGRSMANRKVALRLSQHAYAFGSALNVRALLPDGDKHKPQYPEYAEKLFNAGSHENALKWGKMMERGSAERIDASLDWMEARDWRIRGHVLVWPGWRYSPNPIKALKGDPEALRAAVREHVAETARTYSGRIDDWDVINEPFTNHAYMDVLGREEMIEWLRIARENDDHADFYVNDFDILTRPGSGNPKIPYHLELFNWLSESGAPIDGIGLQSHFVGDLTPVEHLYAMIDRFAQTGAKVQLTELTVNIPDEQTQADYFRDFVTIAFSHPSTNLIQTWGFWEGRMFEPPAAMYRWDWEEKPVAKALKQLVGETFHTELEATTDANGEVFFRGFYGDYSVRVGDTEVIADLSTAGDFQVNFE